MNIRHEMSKTEKNYILITGSNFKNKGSQSMLFSTVHMLKEKYPNKKIVMLSTVDYFNDALNKEQFAFEILPGYLSRFTSPSLKFARKTFMRLIGEKGVGERKEELQQMEEILRRTSFIVDISGFALTSVWKSQTVTINYILRIAAAKYWNIPIYLLSQSIGPFDYSFPYNIVINILNYHYLKYPKIICAREKDGVKSLARYHLKNIKRVNDIVITTPDIKLSNIYKSMPLIKSEIITGTHPIAIIPNMRSLQRGQTEQLLQLYKALIDKYSKDHDIYLLRHSVEDIEGCKLIEERCKSNKKLHVITQDMSCFEFEKLVKQFDFCIASRFHSIVHAYKNGVPCISMGWAAKYKELLESVNQERFIFDVRMGVNYENLEECIDYLESHYRKESQCIIENLPRLQENNPFRFLDD